MTIDFERRKFIKILLLGAGGFLLVLLGRFLGPVLKVFGIGKNNSGSGEKDFKNFKVLEQQEKLIFLDKNGGEILILDWRNIDTDSKK